MTGSEITTEPQKAEQSPNIKLGCDPGEAGESRPQTAPASADQYEDSH